MDIFKTLGLIILFTLTCCCTKSVSYNELIKAPMSSGIIAFNNNDTIDYDTCLLISDYKFFEEILQLNKDRFLIDLDQKETIKKLLMTSDIILSTNSISRILKNTEYTKRDMCPEWLTVIDPQFSTRSKHSNSIHAYAIKPKNEFRLDLCP